MLTNIFNDNFINAVQDFAIFINFVIKLLILTMINKLSKLVQEKVKL